MALTKQRFLSCLTGLSLGLLCACTVGPDYQPPEVASPATLKYDQGWQPLPDQVWAHSGQWWLAFDDTALDTLVRQASDNNLTLAQAEARYRVALAQRNASRSDYSPVIGAGLE